MVKRAGILALLFGVAVAGCAPISDSARGGPDAAGADRPSTTLVTVVRYEVTDLAPKIPGSSGPILTKRIFNAALGIADAQGNPRPYLAQELPQLNSDAWRVFPDGRMETTYRLRPGLSWHDGRPLEAEDFAFAFRVYASPLGVFTPTPQDQIEAVLAPDPGTIVVRWRTPYADADLLDFEDLDPLPRHILEEPFRTYSQDAATAEAFLNHPFWTSDYVGLGPFKLDRWERGSELRGTAFDAHALGRPKIDRVVVRIIGDENGTLTQVLAGAVHFTADFTLRFEHGQVLRREWESAGRGTVLFKPSSPVTFNVQNRPEYVGDPALLDVRVRSALAHSIDRQALNDGLFEGQGFATETLALPDEPHYAEVERILVRHPYDPRQSERVLQEVGYRLDGGMFASPSGQRLNLDVRVTAGPEFERAQAILVDTWRRAGVDAHGSVLAAAEARAIESRHTFPGIASRGGGVSERQFTTPQIATPTNRWVGDNRSGWSNPEFDRLFETFTTTLDRRERIRLQGQLHRILSEQLPLFVGYQAIQINTRAANLSGPMPAAPHWNIWEWELRS